jgi:hypothetical protein
MGNRNRAGSKKIKQLAHTAVNQAMKSFTRAKADKALSAGADPNEPRFTSHGNYHIRARAFKLSGSKLPEKKEEAEKFLLTLQSKSRKKV